MKNRLVILNITIFIIVEFFIFNYITNKNEKIENIYYKNKIEHIKDEYQIVINSFEKLTHTVFQNSINKEAVLEIFARGSSEDSVEKAKARDELYKKLAPFYQNIKSLGVRQVHFHLPTGESFLRFHRPKKYGDNIFDVRKTVLYANKNKIYVQGFEGGKLYYGFRYVYPLFFQKEHIGTVEISIGFKEIRTELEKVLSNEFSLLMKKKNIDKKLIATEVNKHYVISNVSEQFYNEREDTMDYRANNNIPNTTIDAIIAKIKEEAKKGLEGENAFVVPATVKEKSYVAIFIPIKEFGSDTQAFIVTYTDRTIDAVLMSSFKKDFILITLFVLIVFIYFHTLIRSKKQTELRSKQVLEEKVSIQKVFDALSNMTILIEKKEVINGNRAFFDFLNYKNIEDFKRERRELCNYFEGEEFALESNTLFKNDRQWIQKIVQNPEQEFKVYLKGSVFAVNANEVSDEVVIVTFVDITDAIYYQKKLEFEVAVAVEKIEKQHKELLNSAKKAAMGDMIAIIAHQLKQPLSVITLYTDDLEMEYKDKKINDELMEEFTGTIKERVKFMSESIDNYRHFFNPNKKSEKFDLKKAVLKALSIIDIQISSRGIKLIKELDSVVINGYENDMIQVIINIVTNAKDALMESSTKDPEILIQVKKDGKKALITIKDNAGGIDEAIIDKVFDSYFSTKGEVGTGIGLNLAKMVIKDNFSGNISVTNQDGGALFTIEI